MTGIVENRYFKRFFPEHRSRTCIAAGSSATSSRNSVPPWACSK